MNRFKQYILNLFIALDQFLNTIFGGHPDETISGRLGRNYPNSELRKVVDYFFGKGHCNHVVKDGDSAKEVLK